MPDGWVIAKTSTLPDLMQEDTHIGCYKSTTSKLLTCRFSSGIIQHANGKLQTERMISC